MKVTNRNKTLSVEECIDKTSLCFKDTKNDLKKSDTWKIHSTIAINFISSKGNDNDRVMHSKSDNIEIMINDRADEVIKKLFE